MLTVEAVLGRGQPVQFTVTARAVGAPARLLVVSGADQSAAPGATLGDSLVVRLIDDFNNPVSNVEVVWTPVGGLAGRVSPTKVKTGADGRAATAWILGETGGPKQVEATVGSLDPAVFTAAGTVVYSGVFSGSRNTCANDVGGVSYCWGFNDDGQLGIDEGWSEGSSSVPTMNTRSISFHCDLARYLTGDGDWNSREVYLSAVAEWLGDFQTVRTPLPLADLVLLADCFYLPHAEGAEAEKLLKIIPQLTAGRDASGERAYETFCDLNRRIQRAFECLTELRDRELFHAWSRYGWQLKEELLWSDTVLARRQGGCMSAQGTEYDLPLPRAFRGGLLAKLEQFLLGQVTSP